MRLKIALRNLYISQTIILIFLIFSYLLWFPHGTALLGGFYKTAFMLVFVDLVLGPLLVFIVFKEGKKYLKFDINVLLGIQIAAFIWGAYALFLKHPAYAVFTSKGISLTNVSAIYPKNSLIESLKEHFFSSPKFVIAKLPEDSQQQVNLILSITFKELPDIDQQPLYYHQLTSDNKKSIFKSSLSLEQVQKEVFVKSALGQMIKKYGGNNKDYAFFPLRGNNKKDMIWIFDRKSLKPLKIIENKPSLIAKI